MAPSKRSPYLILAVIFSEPDQSGGSRLFLIVLKRVPITQAPCLLNLKNA